MASYVELFTLSLDQMLVQRLTIAVAIAAEAINAEDPATARHDERIAWAKRSMANPDGVARQMLILALAQNKDADASVIAAVDDATLQTAVENAIPLLL